MKLSKDQITRRAQLARAHEDVCTDLNDAIRTANEKIADAIADANKALENYNDSISAINTFIETTSVELRGQYDDKSDNWRESDEGQAADTFIDKWESAEEFEKLEELDEVDDHKIEERELVGEPFEDLPDESEE